MLDFFYAQPVGHAIEALHHALALHRADPTRELSLLLNAATPTELATCCAFITATYPVRAPFVEPAPDADRSLHHVPRDWDWILDDPRRHQDFQFALFAGMRDHYAASDRWFNARIAVGRWVSSRRAGLDTNSCVWHSPHAHEMRRRRGRRSPRAR